MRVVLTGAGGFIGRHVLAELARLPVDVLTISLRPMPLPARSRGTMHSLVVPDGRFCESLANEDTFALVHCAWPPPTRDRWSPHAEHVSLLARLLDTVGDRIERVVAIGSAEEYGARNGCLHESDACDEGLSTYAWGKRTTQLLVRNWSESGPRPAFWLRPFTVYGEGQQGNMAIPYAIRQAVARQPARFSDGRQRRDFIHVADVATGIVAAVQANVAHYHEVNLGTGRAIELREVLSRLARLFHVEALFEFGVLPRRPNEPDEQYADTTVAETILGWHTTIDIQSGLRRVFQHVQR